MSARKSAFGWKPRPDSRHSDRIVRRRGHLDQHVHQTGGLIPPALPAGRGIEFDTAVQYEFLDIGAGVPDWTSQAA
jgi:hypothetical protein